MGSGKCLKTKLYSYLTHQMITYISYLQYTYILLLRVPMVFMVIRIKRNIMKASTLIQSTIPHYHHLSHASPVDPCEHVELEFVFSFPICILLGNGVMPLLSDTSKILCKPVSGKTLGNLHDIQMEAQHSQYCGYMY